MLGRLKNPLIVILILTLLGGVLRFYKLNWGEGYFFHPDERNIAIAASNLNLEEGQFNPQFWAYGSLPIYIIYVIAWCGEKIFALDINHFNGYIMIGRILSASLSTLMIPFVYLFIRKVLDQQKYAIQLALFGSFWMAFLPGMIQFAHYMTFETFLTFQYLLILWFACRIYQEGNWRAYLMVGFLIGISVGTKIVSLTIVPMLFISHFLRWYRTDPSQRRFWQLFQARFLVALIAIPLFAVLASPYHVLDFEGFQGSLDYESGVARGTLPVFYTQQFVQTIPGIYQLLRVFPYILTIPLTVLALIVLMRVMLLLIQSFLQFLRRESFPMVSNYIILTTSIILFYLGFHLTLYVKWTRYMIPMLPFLVILICVQLHRIYQNRTKVMRLVFGGLSLWVLLAGISFWRMYTHPDTRITAAAWTQTNITSPRLFKVTAEIYDLGIVPFNSIFAVENMTLLPIYDLEKSRLIANDAFVALNRSDFFISTSQRIWPTRYRLSTEFPQGKELYDLVFDLDGRQEWKKIADFNQESVDCNLFTLYCFGHQLYPDETFTVFDHPQVMIFYHDR